MDKAQEVRKILQEISEGKGRYSLDPLTHAGNTIEDMKTLAVKAITILDTPPTDEGLREKIADVIMLVVDGVLGAKKALSPLEYADTILAILADSNFVKLSKDQTLPEGVGECMDCVDSMRMLEAGWRKIDENRI